MQKLRSSIGKKKATLLGKKLKLLMFHDIELPYLEEDRNNDRMYGRTRAKPTYATSDAG